MSCLMGMFHDDPHELFYGCFPFCFMIHMSSLIDPHEFFDGYFPFCLVSMDLCFMVHRYVYLR